MRVLIKSRLEVRTDPRQSEWDDEFYPNSITVRVKLIVFNKFLSAAPVQVQLPRRRLAPRNGPCAHGSASSVEAKWEKGMNAGVCPRLQVVRCDSVHKEFMHKRARDRAGRAERE